MTADAVPLPSLAWQPPGQSESALLQRGLGVGAIVFMVVAMAAPLAVVAANVPIVIATGGSVTAPVFFTIVTLILVVFSIGFTAMSRFVPNAGAFYSYIQSGLGRRVGTGSAVVALLSYALLFVGVNAYVGVAAAGALSSLAGWETPWWLWSLLSIVAIGVLGYRDIELSSKVLGFLLIAETLVVIVMNVGIVVRGGESGAALDAWSPLTR